MTLSVDEFLRRFFLHVLPPGFVRIRHFGFLAPRRRLDFYPLFPAPEIGDDSTPAQPPTPGNGEVPSTTPPPLSGPCPQCGGPMTILQRLTAAQIALRSPPLPLARASWQLLPIHSEKARAFSAHTLRVPLPPRNTPILCPYPLPSSSTIYTIKLTPDTSSSPLIAVLLPPTTAGRAEKKRNPIQIP